MAEWIAEYRYKRYDEIKEVINDVFRYSCSDCGWNTGQQGITFQFCPSCGKPMQNANNPRVVPMVKLEAMEAEIKALRKYNDKYVSLVNVLSIVDRYCKEN